MGEEVRESACDSEKGREIVSVGKGGSGKVERRIVWKTKRVCVMLANECERECLHFFERACEGV